MLPVSTRLACARWHAASPAAAVLLLNLAALFPVSVLASADNVYWSDSFRGIHRANLDGSDVQQLVEREARALAIDVSADTMYWNEMFGLMRSNLDGTDIKLIQRTSGFDAFMDIALDVDAAKMYLAHGVDSPGGSLQRRNLDATGVEYLVRAVFRIGAIAVDPGTEALCWNDQSVGYVHGDPPRIMCSNLDATEEPVVVTDALARGMALDGAGKIYWIEPNRIRRANVDGSNVEDLVTWLVGKGMDVALDLRAGEMYWLAQRFDAVGGVLQRAKLDGSDIVELVTGLDAPSQLALDLTPASLPAPIDIKPGSVYNAINPMSRGLIPVAILGSDTFDVAEVEVTALAFGPAGAAPKESPSPRFKDVNRDGFEDLLVRFRTPEAGIAVGDTEACVTGETLGGTPFEGCDSVEVFAPRGGQP